MPEHEIAIIKVSPDLYIAETGEGFIEAHIVNLKEKDGKTLACYQLSHPTAPIQGYWESEIGHDPSHLMRAIVQLHLLQNRNKQA